jgi:hypothetical protein
MSSALWTWERCSEHILSLKNRLGFSETICFLELYIQEDGSVYDQVKKTTFDELELLYWILTHYAEATAIDRTHDLIPYDKLPGGYAFFGAFRQLTIQPLIATFGENCTLFRKCCQYYRGEKQQYGDCSYEIAALPLIPLTIALWERTEEFDARCSVYYDASAYQYLPTEDLAHLGELLSHRLIDAREVIS